MHMLNGTPATYIEGSQVCFSTMTRAIRLCSSLKELRDEWKRSELWRAAKGYTPTSWSHGYRRVSVPVGRTNHNKE